MTSGVKDNTPPFKEDFLQDIVNVHWAGGHNLLACGNASGGNFNVGWLSVSNDAKHWKRTEYVGRTVWLGAWGDPDKTGKGIWFVGTIGSFDAPTSQIYRSNDDGITWKDQPNHPFANNLLGIPSGAAYGNGRFVMGATEYVPFSSTVHAAMSLDGDTWTTSVVTGPRTAGDFQGGLNWGVIFSGGEFLIGYGDPFQSARYRTLLFYNFTTHTAIYGSFETAGGHRQTVFRSADGVNWEGPIELFPSTKNPAAPDDNIFVAVDPTTGERVELPYYIPAPPENTLPTFGFCVPYGPAKGPIGAIAVGYYGIPPHAAASYDKGATWAPGASLGMANATGSSAYGNGLFLTMAYDPLDGSGPTLFGPFRSRDGLNYSFLGESTTLGLGVSNNNAMGFGKKYFLLPAARGGLNYNAVSISKDGTRWTAYPVPYPGGVVRVLY